MKKLLIFASIGVVAFVICYFLVNRIGVQFIKLVPSTEPIVNIGVFIISLLMTIRVLQEIYDLFNPKNRRW
jgi:hypothetical protein